MEPSSEDTIDIKETSKQYTQEQKIAVSQLLVADSHKEILRQVISAAPKRHIGGDEADEMSTLDWIAELKKEIDILRRSDDEGELFKAFNQIRHLSIAAMLAHVRRDIAEAA